MTARSRAGSSEGRGEHVSEKGAKCREFHKWSKFEKLMGYSGCSVIIIAGVKRI